jgi:hypothetical protein
MNGVAALREMKTIISTLRAADICIVSAYMKAPALRDLLEHADPSNQVRIVVRWQPNDLVMGASDTASFGYASNKNWSFYARQDLHAKVYTLGDAAIFVGSANLTSRGFTLTGLGNAEIMVRVHPSVNNLAQVESLLAGAVRITDAIAAEIQAWLDAQSPEKINLQALVWPTNLAQALAPQFAVDGLMTSECFATDGAAIVGTNSGSAGLNTEADLSLLALPNVTGVSRSPELVLSRFLSTKMFRWLVQVLTEHPDQELYFGEASSLLHDALLDDPRPHRQSAKLLLANLLSWITLCAGCGVVVDRPKHSQRIRLAA